MTTIVYRDGILAADSNVSAGSTKIPMKVRKISRLPSGALYGFCGVMESGEIMRRHLVETDQSDEELEVNFDFPGEGFEGLIVRPDGKVFSFEGKTWVKWDAPYVAIGTGSPYAYGALHVGASAKQAVKAACALDASSGGRLQSLKFKEWTGERCFVEPAMEDIE